MLPALSNRTKSFLVICAVLAVAIGNAVFGMDWVNEPGPRRVAVITGTPVLGRPAEAPGLPPVPNAAAQVTAPVPPAAAEAPPQCDVAACAQAYRSFRASDCTYIPSAGQRRLCTKGNPPQ